MLNPIKADISDLIPSFRKMLAFGIGLLMVTLCLSYFHIFGYIGYWGYIIQLFGFTISSGKICYIPTVLLIRRCSPALRYWFTLKPMRIILAIILISEFIVLFSFHLDITVRTMFLWAFLPIYQILSGLRSVQISVDNAERMQYVPEEI